MAGHTQDCIDRYLELSGSSASSFKPVATPNLDDHQLSEQDFTTTGKLTSCAAKIVLKVLYLARVNRLDLLWTVNTLAREVSRWNVACDKRLHRLMSYMQSTKEYVQTCYLGDSFDQCYIAMFVDASFAGDIRDSKSTSGMVMYLMGPNTCVPLSWMCK